MALLRFKMDKTFMRFDVSEEIRREEGEESGKRRRDTQTSASNPYSTTLNCTL